MVNSTHHHFIDKLALVNSLISGIALFPQVFTTIASGRTQGLSMISFIIIFLNSGVWFVYALHRRLVALVVASSLTMIASGILVGLIMFLG